MTRSDGRLIAGPANNRAAAAPGGPPAASTDNARGISKRLGSVSNTANSAIIRIERTRAPLKAPVSERWLIIHIDAQIPSKIRGTTLSEMYATDLA